MKLQFTNGYRPHFDQISRIMQYLMNQDERKKIPQQDIVKAIGLSDRQVENLISMMIGFGLIKPKITTLTEIGKTVIKNDPYFEKMKTLWVIHYIVSSNPEWVVWHRIINTVVPALDRYEVEIVSKKYFSDLAIHLSEKTIENKLPTEVSAVFSSYTRTSLAKINIIQEQSKGVFIKTEPMDIPIRAFLFCIYYFKDNHFPGSSALTISEICQAENSPGLVFNLPENKVRDILENLHNIDLIHVEKFANLDQVRFTNSLSQASILERVYKG